MKIIATLAFFLSLSLGICFAQEKPELKNQKEKESYSLGYQFGQSLKMQGIDLDYDVYASGIRDAIDGKEPKMRAPEIQSTINNLRQRVAAARQKAVKEQAEKNLAEGKAFLAENEKKEGVKALPSGLQYRVLTEGSGKAPGRGDTVSVHYRGTFINGAEFDGSLTKGQPQSFKVDGVIPGWTEALLLMKEGAKWRLFVPPGLAYGEKGMAPRIPPNSVLIFDIELISIK